MISERIIEILNEMSVLKPHTSDLPNDIFIERKGELRNTQDNEPRIKFKLPGLSPNPKIKNFNAFTAVS